MKVVRAHASRRHGISTLLAIAMLGLVSATLAAAASVSVEQIKRAGRLRDEACLRQLLLAGAADTMARAKGWPVSAPSMDWSLELPDALKDDAHVKLKSESRNDLAEVAIIASYHQHQARETLRLRHGPSVWRVISSELEQ